MTTRTVHAAPYGLAGRHRTDGVRCPCGPDELRGVNEPRLRVVVHRPYHEHRRPRAETRPSSGAGRTPAAVPIHPERVK